MEVPLRARDEEIWNNISIYSDHICCLKQPLMDSTFCDSCNFVCSVPSKGRDISLWVKTSTQDGVRVDWIHSVSIDNQGSHIQYVDIDVIGAQ